MYDSNVKVQRTIYSETKCTHAMNTSIISNFLSSQSRNVKDWKRIQAKRVYIFFDPRENTYSIVYLNNYLELLSPRKKKNYVCPETCHIHTF